METTSSFSGLACRDCGAEVSLSPSVTRCPECGGLLDAVYSADAIDSDPGQVATGPSDSLWRFEKLLPFRRSVAVSMGEGATPLIPCPSLAAEIDVGRVLIKDEGANPTGSMADRGLSLATTAAAQTGSETIALPAAGNGGQAAAAYAGRAALEARVFLPSRAGFTQKAMINVHGAELTVVDGRYDDAEATYYESVANDEGVFPVGSFDSTVRHEGTKTTFYEIVESLDWTAPDAIVVPTGSGVGLVGLYKGALEFLELGLIETLPALYAAQSTGCAPIVRAFEDGCDRHERWDRPDTICGEIEIPDPVASPWILDALRESDGGAVSTSDEDILDAGVAVAQKAGVEMDVTGAATASGAWRLAEQEAFDPDATVVVLNAGSGNKDDDVLRNHLVRKGI